MNQELLALFRDLRAQGFSASQAAAYWNELHVLASPILFSRSALRSNSPMRAVALAHARLCSALLDIKTPAQWESYCNTMPVLLHRIQGEIKRKWPECTGAVRDHWPVLAMDEGLVEYGRRITMGHQIPIHCPQTTCWDDVLDRMDRRYALDVLCDQAILPSNRPARSWQEVLRATGLRSLRWSFGDDPGSAKNQERLMEVLLHAQKSLRLGIGWKGPVLGLAGKTSLALTDRGKSDGMVQPDPGGLGQTMTLGHWSVLAHEWMHALDISLARHFHCPQAWATHAALSWDQDPPPPELMAWFWQVGTVLGAPPPVGLADEISKEVSQWVERIHASLGKTIPVQEEITRQQSRMVRGEWTREDSQEGWHRVLFEHTPPPAGDRTAYLLSCDIAFSQSVEKGECAGYWSEFVASLRASLDPVVEAPALPALPPDPIRYITNAVEVMARSFEVSLAHVRAPGLVWLPSSDRPNAGLIWPTPTEAMLHGSAWKSTLATIQPLWNQWRSN